MADAYQLEQSTDRYLLEDGSGVYLLETQFSFFDHFPGSSLDARWTSSTSGAGTVTVADSYAETAAAASADAAIIYYNTKLDKTVSQLWQICVSHHTSSNMDILQIWEKTTAPAPASSGTVDPFWRLRVGRSTSGTTGLGFHKYDGTHTRTMWNGHTTNAWQTPTVLAIPEMINDDYYVLGFEIDGPGARWRLMAWHRDAPTSAFTQDQGLKIFALTDWVLWSTMESTNDLWLVLGEPLTNAITGTIRYEWVRHTATNALTHAWCNGNGPANDYTLIKHHWSHDGYTFIPEDRSTVAVTVGAAGSWDATKTKDRTVVKDGDTYYMVYSGARSSDNVAQLGLATATSPNGPWTKHPGNPIITSPGVGSTEEFLWTPYLIKDEGETDPNKRWKLFYDGIDLSPVAHTIRLATAASPNGTWTKQGICLDVGAGGSVDELGCSNPVVFRNAGIWEVWYGGLAAGGGPRWSVNRATTTDLNSLPYTKDTANNPYIPRDQDAVQDLTADLNGRTATMSSTTGFEVDQYVTARDSAGGSALKWAYSRIRKIVTNTSLELYHGLSGFATASSAQVRGMNAGSVTIHHIEFKNGRWNYLCTVFDIFRSNATLAGDFSETTALCYSTNLLDKPKIWDWINSPNISQTLWDHRDSAENISIVRNPIPAAIIQTTGAQIVAGSFKAGLASMGAVTASQVAARSAEAGLGAVGKNANSQVSARSATTGVGLLSRLASSQVSAGTSSAGGGLLTRLAASVVTARSGQAGSGLINRGTGAILQAYSAARGAFTVARLAVSQVSSRSRVAAGSVRARAAESQLIAGSRARGAAVVAYVANSRVAAGTRAVGQSAVAYLSSAKIAAGTTVRGLWSQITGQVANAVISALSRGSGSGSVARTSETKIASGGHLSGSAGVGKVAAVVVTARGAIQGAGALARTAAATITARTGLNSATSVAYQAFSRIVSWSRLLATPAPDFTVPPQTIHVRGIVAVWEQTFKATAVWGQTFKSKAIWEVLIKCEVPE